ncbi:GGDEF domain-containing protein [Aurantimonas coralicida]|uniref:GGDEF domain-containing protein n=2 Tax=Aurantimonadaceae TaxID=255475 RepID=UPI0009DB8002|nr:GGDEF domain-containing protein [Aurantimonas coralicida]MBC6716066.1 GGDEF domain-containing protein [Aurantimonas sp. DM33-3]
MGMNSRVDMDIGVDVQTLFLTNAMILIVMGLAFYAAWRKQPDETYWPAWIGANFVIAASLFSYMAFPGEEPSFGLALPNSLLVIGFGLRWTAARLFARRRVYWSLLVLPPLVVATMFALPGWFDYPVAYYTVNAILMLFAAATAWEFYTDRETGLPSRYGLLIAYGVMALSFAGRIAQGINAHTAETAHLVFDSVLQIHLLIAVIHTTASGAFVLSIAYERMARDLRHAAMHDALTGLPNRRAFEQRLEKALRDRSHFALVVFDLDHFKSINDRYGHAAGDAGLKRCAHICPSVLRQQDFVARIGGEEFAAILPGVTPTEAFMLTDRVRATVAAARIAADDGSFGLTLSAGIAHSAEGEASFDRLMRAADANLYRAKNGGRNRIAETAAA